MEISDPRARLATLSSAWSWISSRHVWSTFARRWERLVVGVFASKVCTANGELHLSSGFPLLGFPRSCTRLLWIVMLPLRPPGCSPAEALFEGAYDTRSRSCPLCKWLRASWSVGTSRRRHVRIHHVWWSLLLLVEPFCSYPCSRKPAPGTSSAASGRCSRIYPSRGLEESLVLPELLIPSCSCRSCHLDSGN